MPINTDLNIDPYFDDFDVEKQFYKVLFKPRFAVQARELTQLQTMLQNQIEQFGDNIFQEGSIVRGCNFTELRDLRYVKVKDRAATESTAQFDPTQYVGSFDGTTQIRYELEGRNSNLRASIVFATRGFETRPPDLNTFYINYLNTNETQVKEFLPGEPLDIKRVRIVNDVVQPPQVGDDPVTTISVTNLEGHAGNSFGLRSAEGIVFQKGHFLFADEQLVIVSKYSNVPDGVSVGYTIQENLISYLQDRTLLDNANGYTNENAPGADRLQLIPVLTVKPTVEAEADSDFFILSRYQSGNAVQVRDVSQYNVIGQEMARRTFEESGNYVAKDFNVRVVSGSSNNTVTVAVSPGVAYINGFRVENSADFFLTVDPIETTKTIVNQPISFDYGGYVKIDSLTGTVPFGDFTTVDLQNSMSSTIGTAIVSNITPNNLYFLDVQMNANSNFKEVTKVVGDGGFITLANNTVLQEKSRAELVFDSGLFSLRDVDNVSIPIRAITVESVTSGNTDTITIIAGIDEDFNTINTKDDILVVDDSNTRLTIDSVTVSGAFDSVLTIELTPGQTPTANCVVYYNKRLTDATPYNKLSRDVYIKTTFSSSTRQYNLGFPDVYKIISITDSSGNDVTSSFRLNTNQRDTYYDHSYIELLPGRRVPTNGTLTIRMNVFQLGTTSGKQPFFTIASYPIGVPGNEIPVYRSSSGRVYSLRDCFDFRPYVDPVAGADYDASSAGAAPTIASTINLTPSFSGAYIVPALKSTGEADYEYYLSRRDSVVIDSYGKFTIVKGEESEKPTPPVVNTNHVVAELLIPGFPMISPEEASAQNRPQYAVRSTKRGTKVYKMKDIENLEQKIEQLRYYVLLSHLEASTRNLNIVDETGRTRFKNGIIVDPFNDLTIADITNSEFSAAVDFTEKSLTPKIRSFPLNLTYKSNSNATLFPSTSNAKAATLSRNQNAIVIDQPYATNSRNCVSNFYAYQGNGFILPEYDVAYDMVTNPLVLNLDFFGPIQQLVDNINEIIPLTRTDTAVVETAQRQETEVVGRTTNTFTVTDTLLEDTVRTLQVTDNTQTQAVGDFVSNFTFQPYMRSTEVKVYMVGLRPNTQHYFFFDQQDVNDSVAPGTPVDVLENINRNGAFGDAVLSDANGVLRAVFFIPEETFFVGDRRLEITDVNVYGDIESSGTSYGSVTYRAYNFSVDKSSFSVSTRMPESTIISTSSRRTVTDRVLTSSVRRRKDPLAQTFFIKESMGIDSDTVFISAVDLYFKRKSETNGLTVMLREVVNGYPSSEILPFSKVHLTSAQVNVSENGATATTVNFPIPVRLDAEKEYSIVVEPDANDPDYLIYTSKVGGTDLITGTAVVNDWGDGVLFTSTNNRAWQSYQDEDIKFTLYRHNFNASTGSVTLRNDDHEFLTISDSVGKFRIGEFVYAEMPVDPDTGNTVTVIAGNNTITGTGLTDTYSVGDFILVDDGTYKGIFKITDIVSSTELTVDRPATANTTGPGVPIVGGTLVHYDVRNPNSLIVIEHSSATVDKYLQAGDIIYGFDSGATANVASVDNINLSYFQPMIARTNTIDTRTTMSGLFTDADTVTESFTKSLKFNDSTYFNDRSMVLYSRSNDLLRAKPFEITINMSNSGNVTTTPFIDVETAKIFAYQYRSTNVSANTSKYVSKIVELSEGLDAEDFQVYVTAYRPTGTEVKVYIRAQNAYDPDSFDSTDWTELELSTGVGSFSSSGNLNDFREFVYQIPETSKNIDGVFTYLNSSGVEFTGFARFAIKIELLSDTISSVPRVLDYRGIALT